MASTTSKNPVLSSAYHIVENASHAKINYSGIKTASAKIIASLTATPYTASSWSLVPLHPIASNRPPRDILHWIFLVSSLNFSFWSDLPSTERYGVKYAAGVEGKASGEEPKVWTGYWSLLAALHRARDEGLPILEPKFWRDGPEDVLRNAFRSDQPEQMPLLDERLRILREIGTELCKSYGGSYENLLAAADGSALQLVELVVSHFPCYDDKSTFAGQTVFIRKRAQILVAETWAAFDGTGPGEFRDIDSLTMFADYRVPQILHSLNTITYSPTLTAALEDHTDLPNGSDLEIEIRGASIVAIEEIRREIERVVLEEKKDIAVPNAVLLDFLLWDLAKAEESQAILPHHRTRSIFY